MEKLNLGSGDDYRGGWTNLDCRNNVKLDIQHDLNKFPYPFKKDIFDYILIKHVLEHVDDPIKLLQEMTRICKNNAKIKIFVPHATSYANFSSIQHKSNFTENSFTETQCKGYDLEKLKPLKTKFIFKNKWKKYIPFKKVLKIFFNGIYDDLFFEFEVQK